MERLDLNDLIKEITRFNQGIDESLKYLISKFTPVSKAIQIAKNCMDEDGSLIIEKLPHYSEMFKDSLIEDLRKYENWKDFKKEHDKINLTQRVNFSKSLDIMMKMYVPKEKKPRNKNPRG